jgi:ferredoxin--NADP+ reductase
MKLSGPQAVATSQAVAKPLAYNATIIERIDLTDALSIFRIQPDKLPRTRPWFVSGQYCVLGLNNPARPELGSVRRPMSIASAPEVDSPLEFYIRRVSRPESKNPLTHLLWRLQKGDRLYLRTVAAGVFTIKDTVGVDDVRIRVLVASGTGVAPFLSMVRSEVCRDLRADLSNWVLLHGASYPADLGYRDELMKLSATNHLKYWGTVSRPAEAREWTGDVGRVESFFEPHRLPDFERRLGLVRGGFISTNVVIYVCGLTGTISGTINSLIDRGFVPNLPGMHEALGVPPRASVSMFCELYDTEPLIHHTNLTTAL